MKTVILLLVLNPMSVFANDCSQIVSQLRQMKAAQMAVAAQKQSIETNELNRQRTMLRFDDEGRLLEKLWAGEQP